MVKTYTVDKPLFELGNTLGEGCVWDSRSKRLYFVDIDQKKLYTYEPSSGTIGYDIFDNKITAIALLEKGEGLIAVADDFFALIPPSSIPFPPTASRQSLRRIPTSVTLSPNEKRFNDGAVDPKGRFVAGTMGFEHGSKFGKMYTLSRTSAGSWEAPLVQDGVTCTNGMGWSRDGKIMYFTDSWVKEIVAFDYDVSSGKMHNRRVLSNLQEYGEPDGMCQDTDGGIWTCRWQAGKVMRLPESGEVDVIIDFPTAWHMTNCVFGGEKSDELYVTTAASDYNGEILPDRFHGGSLFVVKGLGFTGVERGRFSGSVGDFL